MKLYVVRHGQTEENASGIVQGHNHGTLSSLGIEQSKLLATRLREIQFDAIYTSDLRRALETAQSIAQFQHTRVEQNVLLRERNGGVFQGRPLAELGLAEQQSGLSKADFTPPNGESYRDLQARVILFLNGLKVHDQHETLLIVSHGRWIRMLLALAMNLEIGESLSIKQLNTCVNLLSYDRNSGFTVHLLNCTEHLTTLATIM